MNIIRYFEEFINEKIDFDYLYKKSPKKLKKYIDNLKQIEQRPDKHPEITVYNHTKAVTDRLSKYNDINLSLTGLFHDIGKQDAYVFNDEKKFYQHPGHETESIKYVEKYKDWIEEMGGDYDIIYGIVEHHMKYKFIDIMRKAKQNKIKLLPYYDLLVKFSNEDRGGF